MKPAEDGVTSLDGEYDEPDDCTERICDASEALAACSPAASCRNSDFDSFTLLSASRLAERAAASRSRLASNWSRSARTWLVRIAIVRVSAAASARNPFLCSRVRGTRGLAPPAPP